METAVSEEYLIEAGEHANTQAEQLLQNADKMERFLQKLEKKLAPIPLTGNILSSVPVMMSLLRMYMKKEYTDISHKSLLIMTGGLMYFISPIDLIPDWIPLISWWDDAAVIAVCIKKVKPDLEKYQAWRREHGLEVQTLPETEENKPGMMESIRIFLKGLAME